MVTSPRPPVSAAHARSAPAVERPDGSRAPTAQERLERSTDERTSTTALLLSAVHVEAAAAHHAVTRDGRQRASAKCTVAE
ncbi:hypothetical protein MRX96_018264 [Rhipicephalus microplus]